MLALILASVLVGVFMTLAVQALLLIRWFNSQPRADISFKPQTETFLLPKELQDQIDGEKGKEKVTCLGLNVLLQFLFQELKDTKKVRRWVMKRMSQEFNDMLQTTAGRLLESISVRDFNIGRTFPVLKHITLDNVNMNEDNVIDEVTLLVELTYIGGFQLAVDVEMVFGRRAYLSVTVTKMCGQARLQYTRLPYTHWSFTFTEDPVLEFDVESQFEGRALPQLASVIINQIRKTVRKKHTLPNYKLRYRPFFNQPTPEVTTEDVMYRGRKITEGHLKVMVLGCSRLPQCSSDCLIYCSLAIDALEWLELMTSRRKLWVAMDIQITKAVGQSVGLTFTEEFLLDKYEELVIISSVVPNSPASRANVLENDLLLMVNGVKVTSSKQAVRLVKQAADKLTLRVERCTNHMEARSLAPPSGVVLRDRVGVASAVAIGLAGSNIPATGLNVESNQSHVGSGLKASRSMERFPVTGDEDLGGFDHSAMSGTSPAEPRGGRWAGGGVAARRGINQIINTSTNLFHRRKYRQTEEHTTSETFRYIPGMDETDITRMTDGLQSRLASSDTRRNSIGVIDRGSGTKTHSHTDIQSDTERGKEAQKQRDLNRERDTDSNTGRPTSNKALDASNNTGVRQPSKQREISDDKVKQTRELTDGSAETAAVILCDVEGQAGRLITKDGSPAHSDSAGLKTDEGSINQSQHAKSSFNQSQDTKSDAEQSKHISSVVGQSKHVNQGVSQPQRASSSSNLSVTVNSYSNSTSVSHTSSRDLKAGSSLGRNQQPLTSESEASFNTGAGANAEKEQANSAGDVPDGSDVKTDKTSAKYGPNSLHMRKTRMVKASASPGFNEKFDFDVAKEDSYLNIGVWCQQPEKLDNKQAKVIKPAKDILLGHISIPLMNVALECLTTLQSDVTHTYSLTPSDLHKYQGQHPHLTSHSGFDEGFCCGDVMLHFTYSTALAPLSQGERESILRSYEEHCSRLYSTSGGRVTASTASSGGRKHTSAAADTSLDQSGSSTRGASSSSQHHFTSTHFTSATYCKFCSKKIWFKTAYQCDQCLMVCHKKCVDRCLAQTNCTPTVINQSTATAAGLEYSRKGTSDLNKQTEELRTNLYIPVNDDTGSASKQLVDRKRHSSAPGQTTPPPGPSATDISDAAAMDVTFDLAEADTAASRNLSSSSLQDLTSESQMMSANEEGDGRSLSALYAKATLTHNADENIVNAAKRRGRELHTDLDLPARKTRLDNDINRLQTEIDSESERRAELKRRLDSPAAASDVKLTSSLRARLERSTGKIESLTILLLQYCAGLQHCMDLEQLQQTQLRSELGVEQNQEEEEEQELLESAEQGTRGLINSSNDHIGGNVVKSDDSTEEPAECNEKHGKNVTEHGKNFGNQGESGAKLEKNVAKCGDNVVKHVTSQLTEIIVGTSAVTQADALAIDAEAIVTEVGAGSTRAMTEIKAETTTADITKSATSGNEATKAWATKARTTEQGATGAGTTEAGATEIRESKAEALEAVTESTNKAEDAKFAVAEAGAPDDISPVAAAITVQVQLVDTEPSSYEEPEGEATAEAGAGATDEVQEEVVGDGDEDDEYRKSSQQQLYGEISDEESDELLEECFRSMEMESRDWARDEEEAGITSDAVLRLNENQTDEISLAVGNLIGSESDDDVDNDDCDVEVDSHTAAAKYEH